jgi:hypothetical protein
MKKFICLALVLVICLAVLCSCAEQSIAANGEKESSYSRLVLLYNHSCDDISIYVDKETRVQYMIIRGMECCSIEIMLDGNGKPLLYEGELE